jgi:redox-sensitive bicupin YhaK (pirin superfamily)
MFDYAAPKHFPAKLGNPLGVGQHPHRGFETVTVAFQGEVEHKDSTGNQGVIGEGDVQWMTAGRGIIHEEFHSKKFTKEGGTFVRDEELTMTGRRPIRNPGSIARV